MKNINETLKVMEICAEACADITKRCEDKSNEEDGYVWHSFIAAAAGARACEDSIRLSMKMIQDEMK